MRFITYLAALLTAIAMAGCANPGSGPDGGPYDETPPRIVGMTPPLGQHNVTAKKVSILFDELIKIEKAQEKVIVSPPQREMPEISASGRRINVTLLDTLKPSTTYTIDFSDAIVDNSEGNALGNFTYYFSTGDQIDTMEVAGYVLAADNLEPVKGILVGLHSNLADSAFASLPFERVARTDGNGHFSIKGVAPGKYRIYALKDIEGDYKYTRGEQMAFSRDTIVPSSYPDVRNDTLWADTVRIDTIRTVPYTHYLPDNVVLLAFQEQSVYHQLLKSEREPEWFRLYFTAPQERLPEVRGLNFDSRNAWVLERTAGNDTLTYWLRDTALVNRDSLTVTCGYEATNDSTGASYWRTDTLELVPKLKYERRAKLREQELAKWQKQLEKRHRQGDYSQETPPVEALKPEYDTPSSMAPDQNVHFTVPEPSHVDTAGLHLYVKVDSTYSEAPFRLSCDSLSLRSYTLRAEWRPGQEYVLNVDSACITGISGRVNASYDTKISIPLTETYGSLFMVLQGADTTAVVQLLQGADKLIKQQRVAKGRADFFYLKPGDYYVRMFCDRNGNGQWDTGDFAAGRQAEQVYYFPEKISIKANWDVEQAWNVTGLPLYRQKPRELVKQKEENKKTPQSRNAERARQKAGGQ